MDIWDKEKRSDVMSKIKGKNTKIELFVRKWLFSRGYRFRVNDRRYPGSPDIVLPKYKTVIFVQGCFWHGHICKIAHLPKSNTDYWTQKIEANKVRDERNFSQLEAMGWNVVLVWECEIKVNSKERLKRLLEEIGDKNCM